MLELESKSEWELLEILSNNLDILLKKQPNQKEWVLRHMNLLVDYLFDIKSKLDDSGNRELREFVIGVLKNVNDFNFEVYLSSSGHTNTFLSRFYCETIENIYNKAKEIATKFDNEGGLKNNLINKPGPLIFSNRWENSEPTRVEGQTIDFKIILDRYKDLYTSRFNYLREGKTEEAKKNAQKIVGSEAMILYSLIKSYLSPPKDPAKDLEKYNFSKLYGALSSLIEKLVYACCRQREPNYGDLLELFDMLIPRRNDLNILRLLTEISVGVVTVTRKDLQLPALDCQPYQRRLGEARNQLLEDLKKQDVLIEDLKKQDVLESQKTFSDKLQELTKEIIKECIILLGSNLYNKQFCFLALGSMSYDSMVTYSDLECALLVDENYDNNPNNKGYIDDLLKLFEFKFRSVGEHSLSRDSSDEAAGFHLDAEGHPNYVDQNDVKFYLGTPSQLVKRCIDAIVQNNGNPPNLRPYSLFNATYLYGSKKLWGEYQHQVKQRLSNGYFAFYYMSFHLQEFKELCEKHEEQKTKDERKIDIKSITSTLIYFLIDMKFYCNMEAQNVSGIIESLQEKSLEIQSLLDKIREALCWAQKTRCEDQKKNYQRKPEWIGYRKDDNVAEKLGSIFQDVLCPAYHELNCLFTEGVRSKEVESRNSIIKMCSDYLAKCDARFFKEFGRHSAEEKMRRCTDLRVSARKDGINQLRSKIEEAIDFFSDKIDWQVSLKRYEEELLFLSRLQRSTTNNASGIVQNHRFGHAPLTL
jgi:hypothetical protein